MREGLSGLDATAADDLVELSRHQTKLLSALLEPTLAALAPAERSAVELSSLLPADSIPLPWLRSLVGSTFAEIAAEPELGRPDPWLIAERRLLGLRLLVRGDDPFLCRTHRLLQDVVFARMGEEIRQGKMNDLIKYGQSRGDSIWDGWVDRSSHWEIEPLSKLAFHLMSMEREDVAVAGANLANSIGQPMRGLARSSKARELYLRAIEIKKKAFETDHPTLAVSYSNLALVEQDLGNPAEARRLLLRAIGIDEKAFETDHPNLAIRYSNLALVEKDLGNLAEARRLLTRAIEINEKTFETDHPNLAIGCSNLATVEQDLGNPAEARRLLLRAIRIDEKAFKPDHPNLAIRYSNLALVEKNLGNLAERGGC